MKKKNILLIIGILLIFIGALLPSIRIAKENISFVKDNGLLIIILAAIMLILTILNNQEYILIPECLSIRIIVKFILDNKTRIKEINEVYNCFAKYKYGLNVMLLGTLIVIISLALIYIKFDKIKKVIEKIKLAILNKKTIKANKKQLITQEKLKKVIKKEKKNKIIHETTKDGKIKYNKMTVKCHDKNKTTLKEKISLILLKFKIRKIRKRKLSITKYKDDVVIKPKYTYKVPTIDIKRWTRNSVCCINCGATISSNSEYCFLCDCKIKLSDKKTVQ